MGYETEADLYQLFHYIGKKIFKRACKNLKANDPARPDDIFWAVGYHSPPESQLAFLIYYVKYENILMC